MRKQIFTAATFVAALSMNAQITKVTMPKVEAPKVKITKTAEVKPTVDKEPQRVVKHPNRKYLKSNNASDRGRERSGKKGEGRKHDNGSHQGHNKD